MGESMWTAENGKFHHLVLECCLVKMELGYRTGNSGDADALFDLVISKTKSEDDSCKAYSIKCAEYEINRKYPEAIELSTKGLQGIAEFSNFVLPKNVTMAMLDQALDKVMAKMIELNFSVLGTLVESSENPFHSLMRKLLNCYGRTPATCTRFLQF